MDFENSHIEFAKAENETLIEDPKSARKRKRADKRRRKKYKFTDKKHSKAGIVSSLLVLPSLALIVISIVMATSLKGEAGSIVGIFTAAAIVLSTLGIVLSSLTFRKADTIFTFSWIGLTANIIIWLFVAFIIVIGI